MNTQNINIQALINGHSKKKHPYMHPEITLIQLDNEISLALESNPPNDAPGEVMNQQDFYNSNPFPLA